MKKIKRAVHIEALESRLMMSTAVYTVDDTGAISTIDVTTAAATPVGPSGQAIKDIAENAGGLVFGVDATKLYSINTTTGAATAVGALGAGITLNSLAFSNDGTLYAAGAGTSDDLFTINTTTGAATAVGPLGGFTPQGDLAFDGSGNLFMVATTNTTADRLVSVNIATGQATSVGAGATLGFTHVDSLAFTGGIMYGLTDADGLADASMLFTINLTTGVGSGAIAYTGETGAVGAASPPTAFVLGAPTNVTASINIAGSVRVSYSAVPGATSYTIFRNTVNNSGTATQIATGITATTFADTTAAPATTYFYFVEANNGGAPSAFSAAASGMVFAVSNNLAAPIPQLTSADVLKIVTAAANVSLDSQTIVVVDRAGNVLAMYGQDPGVAVDSILSNDTANLVEAMTPDTAAKYAVIQATARARTAAFFASQGDAFTTRTARFIIGNQFPQGVNNTEAGPLLGVEFSNALGSDGLPPGITTGLAAGLNGDPGGMGLFINGQAVGGIGVAGDGNDVAPRQDLVPELAPGGTPANSPALDSDLSGAYYTGSEEPDLDEAVALAGELDAGFGPPQSNISTNIFVNGLALPYVGEKPATAPPAPSRLELTGAGAFGTGTPGLQSWIVGGVHTLPNRTFFAFKPLIGDPSYLAAVPTANLTSPGGHTLALPDFAGSVNTSVAGVDFIGGTSTAAIYPQIELPLSTGGSDPVFLVNNSPAVGGYGINAGIAPGTGVIPTTVTNGQVPAAGLTAQNFGFVDLTGGGLGTDQSGAANNGQSLDINDVLRIITQALNQQAITRAAIRDPFDVPAQVYVAVTDTQGNILAVVSNTDATDFSFDVAIQKARTAAFFSDPSADPTYAMSSRTVGFLADSTIPPALRNGANGPLYQLQETLALPFNQAMFNPDVNGSNPLGNGITIFPGGAPLFKDGVLVGGIGISGDGVDQDDLIDAMAAAGFAAPPDIRADALSSGQLVTALEKSISRISNNNAAGDPFLLNGLPVGIDPIVGDVFPEIGVAAGGLPSLTSLGFRDPESLVNSDGISALNTDDILDRIVKRLRAVGVDGVNLPFQKFPRNPEV